MTMLDLPDIQGNIHRPYGRFGFPYARHMVFHVADSAGGRRFVEQVRHYVTTSEPWASSKTQDDPAAPKLRPKPQVVMNIGFTWDGLQALGLPTTTLRLMPDEFYDGMACRKSILGDVGRNDPQHWDAAWKVTDRRDPGRVHILITLHAQADDRGAVVDGMRVWTAWLQDLVVASAGGVAMLLGHGPSGDAWQDSSTIMATLPDGRRVPTPKEHFGFTDGISDPTYVGQSTDPAAAVGAGKIMPGDYDAGKSWRALATGEFILGHPSEGQELPTASAPASFMRNGTFMAVRKLHQNVASFRRATEAQAARYQVVAGLASREEARETLLAKMVGRWTSGIPLTAAPTYAESQALAARLPGMSEAEVNTLLTSFRYADDPEGLRCPVSAHIRRANPRDMLDPEGTAQGSASTLTNRRRIMRRGLPYGDPADDDESEHGVFIMALCTSLFRQFEFIQQQWMNYGLDFNVGNDTDPIVGIRDQSDKFVIAADPKRGGMPYVCANLPQFVETRGGDYFFIPSLTALRMIAMGTIDPT